jgi:Uma2 family endonuclease
VATITDPPEIFPGLTLHNVEWETYCRLRDDPAHDRLRMIYLDGDLTIMSPQYRHDGNSRRIFLLVTTVAGAWEIDYMPIGTTTLRRAGRTRTKGAGKEADEGFYLGADEAKVRDNDDINLAVDPPPTLAIEVDNLADSEVALPAYARIGVPEVWIYKAREHSLWFGRLAGDHHVEVDRSVVLPRLTPTLVLQALDARAAGMGDRLWSRWLEEWARTLPEPPEAVS